MSEKHVVAIGRLTFDLPIVPVNNVRLVILDLFSVDGMRIIEEAAGVLYQKLVSDLPTIKRFHPYDCIVTPEGKGVGLAYALARFLCIPVIVPRKTQKSYKSTAVSTIYDSITSGQQHLFLSRDEASYLKGKNVLVVDDVVSTGATVEALKKLIDICGGQVGDVACIFTEGGPKEGIISLGDLPVFPKEEKPQEPKNIGGHFIGWCPKFGKIIRGRNCKGEPHLEDFVEDGYGIVTRWGEKCYRVYYIGNDGRIWILKDGEPPEHHKEIV